MLNTIPCNPFPPSSLNMNGGAGKSDIIDGAKTRVYTFDTTLEVSNTSWTPTGLTLTNAKILSCFGVNNDNTCFPLLGSIDANGAISLSCARANYGATIDDLIIEYIESEG